MPIVPPADMLPNPVFYPCFTCPKRGFCGKKVPKKMGEKAFSASKTPQNSPRYTRSKNTHNTLTHKRITTNHPIFHPLRLENYFFSNFCPQPPKNAPESTPN